jgi:hypothetical protein
MLNYKEKEVFDSLNVISKYFEKDMPQVSSILHALMGSIVGGLTIELSNEVVKIVKEKLLPIAILNNQKENN